MSSIDRVRVVWTGFAGAPGVSTFYATSGSTLVNQLHTFFDTIKSVLPSDVHLSCEASGDTIESTTGEITGAWVGGAFATVVGTSASGYAALAGALVRWDTATIIGGRRIRGHTFIVPLGGNMFDVGGQVTAACAAILGPNATSLVTAAAGNMLIYQRVREAKAADGSRKAVTHRDGFYGAVTAARVGTSPTLLVSRRD